MSTPSAIRVGPNISLILLKKRYISFYIFIIWISFFIVQFEFWWYWNLLYDTKFLNFVIFFPFLIIFMYLTMVFVSLIMAKILIIIVNKIHKPREGTFLRNPKDKDFRYWCIRNTIKKWPIWLSHKFPFPFLDNICLMLFGVKTKYSNSLFEGYVDTEFIEFGKDIVVGQASIVQSAVIIGNLFIIKKTVIKDNVKIGVHSVIMPGSIIEKNSILGASSMTTIGQHLEEGWVYLGAPAKKFKKNVFFEEGIENKIIQEGKYEKELHNKYEGLYTKRRDTLTN
ncbi:MAG: hypothetical protein KGD68_04790 [Candidatus Lokiarchaeota archaeon]|nr:hypothetical protein [Candidatus Lokiarchaeota archaeon]